MLKCWRLPSPLLLLVKPLEKLLVECSLQQLAVGAWYDASHGSIHMCNDGRKCRGCIWSLCAKPDV